MSLTTLLHLPRNLGRNIGLADFLSLSRGLLTFPVVLVAVHRDWKLFAILVTIAWVTDLFDGSAARRPGAKSLGKVFPNLDVDGINDSILAFGSTGALVWVAFRDTSTTTAVLLSALWVVTAIVGSYMVAVSMNQPEPNQLHRRVIAFNMIVLHSLVQIGGTIIAGFALGFGFWPAYIAFVLLCATAFSNRHKAVLWMNGRFSR